jgi:hypothetical protein
VQRKILAGLNPNLLFRVCGENGIRIPILRTRSPCCARAASGQAAAPTPSSVMNLHVSFDHLVGA